MKQIPSHRLELSILVFIIFLYFILRLPNLTLQPIFADEAIYIRWAQVMRAEPSLRFLPLTDGKTPLFMWSMIPLLKIIEDPLFAGRLLSVISGFATLLGVIFLSWKVFGVKVAYFSALLVAITPYMVFFDRMALVDSMLAAFSIWALIFSVLLLSNLRLDLAMFLGYMFGGGLLTKTPALVSILILPITLIGFDFKNRRKEFLKLLTLWVVAIVIALAMYNGLRLGPSFHMISLRNEDYVHSINEILKRPYDPFLPHFKDTIDYFVNFLTIPIFFILIYGTVHIISSRNKLGIVIFLWAIIPLIIQMAFLKTFTARYLLFSIPPLLILAGFGLEKIMQKLSIPRVPKKVSITMILGVLALVPMQFNISLILNPEIAHLPKGERRGYLEDWTAGYGMKDIAQYLIEQKKNGSVVVGTEGYFGTLPDGLQIYLDKSEIPVIGGNAIISEKLRDSASDNQTFFIANKNRIIEEPSYLVKIKEYPKAKPSENYPQDAIMLYKVLPK